MPQTNEKPGTSIPEALDDEFLIDPDALHQEIEPISHYAQSAQNGATLLDSPRHQVDEPPDTVISLRPKFSVPDRSISLQAWEGMVLQVLEDSFIARLVDRTSNGPDEEAEFPLEEVSDADRFLIEPGAVFYWHIGYRISESGQRTRASDIRFRRLPVWSSEDLKKAKQEAQQISDLLDWK